MGNAFRLSQFIVEDGFTQLGIQFVGIVAFSAFSIITSTVLWKILGAITGGIRVTDSEEIEGLDIGEHGMEAYPDFATSAK